MSKNALRILFTESMDVRAICENCKCEGKLFKRNQSGDVILISKESENVAVEAEDSKKYKKRFLAPHGFGTKLQMINVVAWGTVFWVAVMLVANYVSFEKNRFKAGVGSYCVREYKKCALEFDWNLCASSMYNCGNIEDDNYSKFIFSPAQKIASSSNIEQSLAVFSDAQNKANENLCLFTAHVSNNICENLCFSSDFSYDSDENYEFDAEKDEDRIRYNHQKNAECKSICLLASDLEIEEDCPFHKRCPRGCPCPGYKCSTEIFDYDLAGVNLLSNVHGKATRSSIYKISLQSNTVKFDDLTPGYPWTTYLRNYFNFCIVNFHGNFYIIQEQSRKLTLFEIDQNGNLKKLSEDYVTMQIVLTMGGIGAICSRGIYQNDEERIIFCSKEDSRGICHSYAINQNKVLLTEIYNRPQSTLRELNDVGSFYEHGNGVFGLTFQNKLTTLKMVNSFRSASITSFEGREKSGNHLWTHKQVNFPTSYRDRTIDEESISKNVQLLAAFSDNEGIIFITHNSLYEKFLVTDEREDIIRFHRIYRNNWFFLGRYKTTRKRSKINSKISGAFMFQGNFLLYEDVQKCRRGSFNFVCLETKSLPPKIHLLDRATDSFVEQKLDINYQNYDYFSMSL